MAAQQLELLDTRPPVTKIGSGWVSGMAPPPKQTVSQWADNNRHIAAGTGSEEGRWRTDRAPFQREPMDVVADPDVETVVLMWSSQVGKTEVLINAAGYYIDAEPAPILYVMPTIDDGESFSRSRFGPTINATPALLSKIGAHSSRETSTTIRAKVFPGGDIYFAGANSPSSLASRPRRVVVLDEIDKFKQSIGNDGDPIKQTFQRTQNFWNRKKLLASTPTLEGLSAIADWFKRSDQRFYEVPCPHCAKFQALEWEQVGWSEGKPETAYYVCGPTRPDLVDTKGADPTDTGCGTLWTDRELKAAVHKGRWYARQPFNGIAGFHVNALASPWVTLAHLAREWEESEGDPTEEQTFWNLKLGRTYNPTRAAQTTPELLFARKEDYDADRIPDGVLAITSHTDVQSDRFETTFLGWGVDDEKWVIDHVVTYADLTDPQAWNKLDATVLSRSFAHPLGGSIVSEATGIDAGYLQTQVMQFVASRVGAFRKFFSIKGVHGFGNPLWRVSKEKYKQGMKLHLSGVDDGKTQIYQELAVVPDETRKIDRPRVHFPSHLPLEYFRQLVSERVKIEIKAGRPVPKWILPSGKRNEALDCIVGAMAVRQTLSIDYHQRRRQRTGSAKKTTMADIAALFGAQGA